MTDHNDVPADIAVTGALGPTHAVDKTDRAVCLKQGGWWALRNTVGSSTTPQFLLEAFVRVARGPYRRCPPRSYVGAYRTMQGCQRSLSIYLLVGCRRPEVAFSGSLHPPTPPPARPLRVLSVSSGGFVWKTPSRCRGPGC